MNSANRPSLRRPAPERPQPDVGSLLFDRASLEGLVCEEAGWEEWDTCVAEQDLRLAIAKLLH